MGNIHSRNLLKVQVGEKFAYYDLADGEPVLSSEITEEDNVIAAPLLYEMDDDDDEWIRAKEEGTRLGLTPELKRVFDAIARRTGENMFIQYPGHAPDWADVTPRRVTRRERAADAMRTRPHRKIVGLMGPCTVSYWKEFSITGRGPLRLMLLGEHHSINFKRLTAPRTGPGIAMPYIRDWLVDTARASPVPIHLYLETPPLVGDEERELGIVSAILIPNLSAVLLEPTTNLVVHRVDFRRQSLDIQPIADEFMVPGDQWNAPFDVPEDVDLRLAFEYVMGAERPPLRVGGSQQQPPWSNDGGAEHLHRLLTAYAATTRPHCWSPKGPESWIGNVENLAAYAHNEMRLATESMCIDRRHFYDCLISAEQMNTVNHLDVVAMLEVDGPLLAGILGGTREALDQSIVIAYAGDLHRRVCHDFFRFLKGAPGTVLHCEVSVSMELHDLDNIRFPVPIDILEGYLSPVDQPAPSATAT